MIHYVNLPFGGLANSMAENLVPFGHAWECSNVNLDRGILEKRFGSNIALQRVETATGLTDTGYGFGLLRASVNTVYKLKSTAACTITYGADTTPSLATSTTAAEVITALENLSTFNIGEIKVTGTTILSGLTIEFVGALSNTNVTITSTATSLKKQVAGGSQTEILVVLKKAADSLSSLYMSNPALTGAMTVVTNGDNALANGNWLIKGYKSKAYLLHGGSGLFSKGLGASELAARLNRPTRPADNTVTAVPNQSKWALVSLAGTETLSADITGKVTVTRPSSTLMKFVATSELPVGDHSVTVTLTTDVDLSGNDAFKTRIYDQGIYSSQPSVIPKSTHELSFINADGSPSTITSIADPGTREGLSADPDTFGIERIHLFGTGLRSLGDNVHQIKFEFEITKELEEGAVFYIRLFVGDVWMASSTNYSEIGAPDATRIPAAAKMEYAVSYWRASDGLESDLSLPVQTPQTPISKAGSYVTLTAPGSTALNNTTDKVYFYRREKGTSLWRMIPNLDGTYGVTNDNTSSSTVTLQDRYMEGELAGFPQYGDEQFTVDNGVFASANMGLDTWKGSLAIGGNGQLWISYTGQPEKFAPSVDDTILPPANPDDPNRGVTEYVSNSRTEQVRGVHGLDSIYTVTDQGCYVKVGDSPAESSFSRKLPGSRGGLTIRASCAYSGGALVAALEGLFYYAAGRGFRADDDGALVEREETMALRTSWDWLVTGGYSNICAIEHRNEILVCNGSKYLHRSRNLIWTQGTFNSLSVKALLADPILGILAMDVYGKVWELDPDYEYDDTADALIGDAREAIAWSYETGWIDSPERKTLAMIVVQGTGSPTIRIDYEDGTRTGAKSIAKTADVAAILNIRTPAARRFKLTVSGSGNQTVESLMIGYEDAASRGAKRT